MRAKNPISGVLPATLGVLLLASSGQAQALYDVGDSTSELRFGANLGAGSGWNPPDGATSVNTTVGFGGRSALSCSGLDYQTYIRSIDPGAMIKKYTNTFMSGAQAAVTNYLLSMAYANPTVASVIDTMNQDYSAQFGAFASQCSLDEAKRIGAEKGAKKMADAKNECYEAQVKQGVAPAQAYDACKSDASAFAFIANNKLPSSKPVMDFLKDYTNFDVTKKVSAMLGLVSDQVVTSSGLQMRPPETTLFAMEDNLTKRASIALNLILNGTSFTEIRNCTATDMKAPPTGAGAPSDACLPEETRGVVATPGFLGARQLSASARGMYVDAMSSQIAIAAIRENLVTLQNDLAKISLNPAADVDTETVENKKKDLNEKIQTLRAQADAIQEMQQAKAQLAKTQLASLDQVQRQLNGIANRGAQPVVREAWWTPQSILRTLMRMVN